MKVELWTCGAQNMKYLQEGFDTYAQRLNKYFPFRHQHFNAGKAKSPDERMEKEKNQIEKQLKPGDCLILLDEHGQTFTSDAFAVYLQQLFNRGDQRLIFLAGSSHGFHQALKDKAHTMIALSQMTFNHEHTRLIFMEQLYRAMTLINNEPYHH